MEIQDLARAIWKKKWTIIFTTLIGCVVAIYFLANREEKFRSEARLETGYTRTEKLELGEGEPPGATSTDVKFSNLLELMNAPLSINMLSYRLLLHDLDKESANFRDPRDATPHMEENEFKRIGMFLGRKVENILYGDPEPEKIQNLHSWEEVDKAKQIVKDKLQRFESLDPGDPDFELMREFLLEFGYDYKSLREALYIRRLQGSDYLQVSFVSENNDLSAYAANAYCEEFIRYYGSLTGEYSTESVDFLKTMAEEKKAVLDEKLAELSQMRTSNLPGNDLATGTLVDQLVGLENQKSEITSKLQELNLTINRLENDLARKEGPNDRNSLVVELQRKIEAVNSRYISGGSVDRELADSLAHLRSKLRRTLSGMDVAGTGPSAIELEEKLKDAKIALRVEEDRLAMVSSKMRELNYGFSSQTAGEAEKASVQNDVEMARQEYMEVLNKYNLAKNMQVSGSSLRQVLEATPSLTPVSIRGVYLLAIIALSCMVLSVLVVLVRETMDGSIKTPSRFRRMVSLPLLGALNRVNVSKLNIHSLFLTENRGRSAEIFKSSLRQLRHNIVLMNAKVILFTSLKPKVGKTSVICSLAYVLSLLKKRVLIIDTNFKSSSLTEIYGKGLKEIKVVNRRMVLSRPAFAKVIQNGSSQAGDEFPVELNSLDLVNATEFEDIFFVGNNGVTSHSPAEMLSSKDFRKFILMMAEQFDYVFLEGPAINNHSDSKELVKYVQKVVTVFAANDAVDPRDEHSIEYLNALSGKQGGAILTMVNNDDMNM